MYTPARRGQQRVTANFALRKGDLTNARIDDIVEAIAATLPPHVHTVVAHSREKAQLWRYTLARPAEGWFKPGFDDSSWKSGPGGLGTVGTPGAVVRTLWNTDAIWLRRARPLRRGTWSHKVEHTVAEVKGGKARPRPITPPCPPASEVCGRQ